MSLVIAEYRPLSPLDPRPRWTGSSDGNVNTYYQLLFQALEPLQGRSVICYRDAPLPRRNLA